MLYNRWIWNENGEDDIMYKEKMISNEQLFTQVMH